MWIVNANWGSSFYSLYLFVCCRSSRTDIIWINDSNKLKFNPFTWHFCARVSIRHDFGDIHNPWIPRKPYILTISRADMPCSHIRIHNSHIHFLQDIVNRLQSFSSFSLPSDFLSTSTVASNKNYTTYNNSPQMAQFHLVFFKETQSCQMQNYHTRSIDQIIRWRWNCLMNSPFVCALLSIHHSSNLFFSPSCKFFLWPRSNM